MDAKEYERLRENVEVAYFGAELYREFPKSYGIEDACRTVREIDSAEEAVDDAMREDFARLSLHEQERMLALLAEHGTQDAEWWRRILRP